MAGFSAAEVMQTLKIDSHLYYKFIKMLPSELIDEWKATKIMSVENSLYMACNGFTKTIYEDVVDKEGITHTLAKEKYFPPNVQAIKYYLNNQKSNEWKDKSELVVNNVKDMPMSELEAKVRTLLEKKKEKKHKGLKALEQNRKGVEVGKEKDHEKGN